MSLNLDQLTLEDRVVLAQSTGLLAIFEDPISFEIMDKAMMTTCGHSFSEETINNWIVKKNQCPLCNKALRRSDVTPNYALRNAIARFLTAQAHLQQNIQNALGNVSVSSEWTTPASPTADDWKTPDESAPSSSDSKLLVEIISARDLKTDWFGKTDPYCVLEFQDQKRKTSIAFRNRNPTWGEVFVFNVTNLNSESNIVITTWDKDRILKDSFIGMVTISMGEVITTLKMVRRFALQKKRANSRKRISGDILLRLQFLDLRANYEFGRSTQSLPTISPGSSRLSTPVSVASPPVLSPPSPIPYPPPSPPAPPPRSQRQPSPVLPRRAPAYPESPVLAPASPLIARNSAQPRRVPSRIAPRGLNRFGMSNSSIDIGSDASSASDGRRANVGESASASASGVRRESVGPSASLSVGLSASSSAPIFGLVADYDNSVNLVPNSNLNNNSDAENEGAGASGSGVNVANVIDNGENSIINENNNQDEENNEGVNNEENNEENIEDNENNDNINYNNNNNDNDDEEGHGGNNANANSGNDYNNNEHDNNEYDNNNNEHDNNNNEYDNNNEYNDYNQHENNYNNEHHNNNNEYDNNNEHDNNNNVHDNNNNVHDNNNEYNNNVLDNTEYNNNNNEYDNHKNGDLGNSAHINIDLDIDINLDDLVNSRNIIIGPGEERIIKHTENIYFSDWPLPPPPLPPIDIKEDTLAFTPDIKITSLSSNSSHHFFSTESSSEFNFHNFSPFPDPSSHSSLLPPLPPPLSSSPVYPPANANKNKQKEKNYMVDSYNFVDTPQKRLGKEKEGVRDSGEIARQMYEELHALQFRLQQKDEAPPSPHMSEVKLFDLDEEDEEPEEVLTRDRHRNNNNKITTTSTIANALPSPPLPPHSTSSSTSSSPFSSPPILPLSSSSSSRPHFINSYSPPLSSLPYPSTFLSSSPQSFSSSPPLSSHPPPLNLNALNASRAYNAANKFNTAPSSPSPPPTVSAPVRTTAHVRHNSVSSATNNNKPPISLSPHSSPHSSSPSSAHSSTHSTPSHSRSNSNGGSSSNISNVKNNRAPRNTVESIPEIPIPPRAPATEVRVVANEDSVRSLMEMGFERDLSVYALQSCSNDMELALDKLLNNTGQLQFELLRSLLFT